MTTVKYTYFLTTLPFQQATGYGVPCCRRYALMMVLLFISFDVQGITFFNDFHNAPCVRSMLVNCFCFPFVNSYIRRNDGCVLCVCDTTLQNLFPRKSSWLTTGECNDVYWLESLWKFIAKQKWRRKVNTSCFGGCSGSASMSNGSSVVSLASSFFLALHPNWNRACFSA